MFFYDRGEGNLTMVVLDKVVQCDFRRT